MNNPEDTHLLTFSDTPTEREIDLIRQRMAEYNHAQTHGEYNDATL